MSGDYWLGVATTPAILTLLWAATWAVMHLCWWLSDRSHSGGS